MLPTANIVGGIRDIDDDDETEVEFDDNSGELVFKYGSVLGDLAGRPFQHD